MGNTYTVEVWKKRDWDDSYGYEMIWQGESFLRAIIELVKAKRLGYGCTTLSWR